MTSDPLLLIFIDFNSGSFNIEQRDEKLGSIWNGNCARYLALFETRSYEPYITLLSRAARHVFIKEGMVARWEGEGPSPPLDVPFAIIILFLGGFRETNLSLNLNIINTINIL
jgi:hypothetical protein